MFYFLAGELYEISSQKDKGPKVINNMDVGNLETQEIMVFSMHGIFQFKHRDVDQKIDIHWRISYRHHI